MSFLLAVFDGPLPYLALLAFAVLIPLAARGDLRNTRPEVPRAPRYDHPSLDPHGPNDWDDPAIRVPGLSLPPKRRTRGRGPSVGCTGDISWLRTPPEDREVRMCDGAAPGWGDHCRPVGWRGPVPVYPDTPASQVPWRPYYARARAGAA